MPESGLRQNSLVLYKNQPGRVKQPDNKKIEIEVEGGQSLKVRPKDVILLHPGPLQNLAELTDPSGEIVTAWELLAGEKTNLIELAELAYGEYTPASAWAAWQLLADGLYFSGTPDEIMTHSPEAVAKEKADRQAKALEKQAWADFIERLKARRCSPEDGRYLNEVEALALGKQEQSQVLRALDITESPQSAHALLLDIGYWEITRNPFPEREGAILSSPDLPLPALPDESRRDLTHLTALAIDDEGNQDPDDALSLENGRLWVHIADAAVLVPPDSPVDLEARARGANLYLPEGAISMLPRQATELLGLGLSEISPALSFGMKLTAEGEISDLEIVPSWVKVTRLTYEEAEGQMDVSPFKELYALAQTYETRRRQNGSIEIDLPEVKVRVVEDEVNIRPLPPLRSRDMVREAMLMTGEAVARFAIEHEIPMPFSVQDPPERDSSTISDSETAVGMADMFALRRTLKRSRKQTSPAPHSGLGLEMYIQATSPLRRYLDLVSHQQLRAFLRGGPVLNAQEVMERVGAVDAVEGGVRRAERFSNDHWSLIYLMQHPEWQGEGVVVDKVGMRARILIPELGIESDIYPRQELPLDTIVPLELNKVNLAEQSVHFKSL